MHGFQGFQPTKSRANVDADAVRYALRDGQTRILQGFLTRCHGKVDEAIHAAQVTFVDIVLRSKILRFPGDLGRILVRVKAGNRADARHPRTELFPDGINGDAQGGNRPEASDHHASLHGLLSLHYFLGWPSRTIQAVHVECESVCDVRTCALYTDRALQYSMGVSRYQQLSHRKGYIWDRV